MDSFIRCISLTIVLAVTVSAAVLLVLVGGLRPALAAPAVWGDPEKAEPHLARLQSLRRLQITPETLMYFHRLADDRKRQAETAAIARTIDDRRDRWYELLERLDGELKAVTRRAEGDAKIRSVITFIRVVSATAQFLDALSAGKDVTGLNSSTSSQSAVENQPPEAESPVTGDTIEAEGTVIRTLRIRTNGGEWRTIDHRAYIYRQVISSEGEGLPPSSSTGELPLGDVMDALDQAAAALGSEVALDCYSDWGGGACSLLPSVAGTARQPAAGTTKPDSEPDDWQKELYGELTSLGADLLPGVGQIKSVTEVISGRDPITGSEVNRVFAAIGLIPGAKLLGKGAKGVDGLIRALDKADAGRARKFIQTALGNWRFVLHTRGEGKGALSGDFPVAMLKPAQAERIGANTRVVRLSPHTAKVKARPENLGGHELLPEDYRWVQAFIDTGEILDVPKVSRSGVRRHIGVVGERDGGLWHAVFKATDDAGDKVYLQSLRKTRSTDLERLRRRSTE